MQNVLNILNVLSTAIQNAYVLRLIRLKEIGLLNFGDSRYIHDQDVSCYDPAGWSSAGLGNVLSSVIILGGGWFFSVLILFFEMAWLHKTVGNAWCVLY